MRKTSTTPRGVVRKMLDGSGLSNAEASRILDKNITYLNKYTTEGRSPTMAVFADIAKVCGYELHLIGHGEDITVTDEPPATE